MVAASVLEAPPPVQGEADQRIILNDVSWWQYEVYKGLKVREVWLWQDEVISIHVLVRDDYETVELLVPVFPMGVDLSGPRA